MAYATGSLTDANSSLALYNVMAGLLTTAGYTLVDTVVISTRTHKVWKSAAANNSMNLDWYLDVAYTTTGVGPMHLTPFEFFDPATDLGYRGAYAALDATIEATYGSRYGATGYALETNWFTVGTGIATSASFGYWLSVTGDRVIGLSSLAPTLIRYSGFYTPKPEYATLAGAKLFPLVKVEYDYSAGTSGSGYVGLTRTAPATVLTQSWSRMVAAQPEISYSDLARLSPPVGSVNMVGDGATASRVRISSGTNYASNMLWGWLKDVFFVPLPVGAVRGDTVTIAGNTYVAGSYDGSYTVSAAFLAA